MLAIIVDTVKEIFVAFAVALPVTIVAVLITPPCSDLGSAGPVYCLGGLGTQKILIFLALVWVGLSIGFSLRAGTSDP